MSWKVFDQYGNLQVSCNSLSPTTAQWLLNGNTNGSEKTLGTLDAYGLPLVINGVEIARFIYSSDANINGNFGVNVVSPTARIHARGADRTSGYYTFKSDDHSSNPLLYVRNDGYVGIGSAAPLNGELLTVSKDQNNSTSIVVSNQTAGASSNVFIELSTDVSSLQISSMSSLWSGGTEIAGSSSIEAGNDLYISTLTANSLLFSTNSALRAILDSSGNLGVGISSPTSRLHAKGSGSTSATFSAKFENSSAFPSMNIDNAGRVAIGYTSAFEDASLYILNQNSPVKTYGLAIESHSLIAAKIIQISTTGTAQGLHIETQSSTTGEAYGLQSFSQNTTTSANYGGLFQTRYGVANIGVWGNVDAGNGTEVHNTGVLGTINNSGGSTSSGINKAVNGIIQAVANNSTSYGGYFIAAPSNAPTGATVIGGYFSAANGATNYAIVCPASGGNISLLNLPVGNSGLASGDLYVDTAANILTNTDKIVARKV